MKSIVWICILTQLPLSVESVTVDTILTCDRRVLPFFEYCMCGYKERYDQNKVPYHDLVRINCTNVGKDDSEASVMLSNLSDHLRIAGYTQLEELIFVGNIVHELPINLVGRESFSYLEHLDLSNNSIHTIPGQTFHSLPILSELILDNNDWEIDLTSTRVFNSVFNIEILSLNNAFTTEKKSSMHMTALGIVFEESKLDYLRELYLENNHILQVSADVFQHLPSLEVLSLANNNISSLEGVWNSTCFPSEFVDQTMLLDHWCILKTLNLSNNDISAVSAGFIDEVTRLKSLQMIDLTGNPFTCDCNLLPFYDFIMAEVNSDAIRIANLNQLMCVEPSPLAGRLLVSLTRKELRCESFSTEKPEKPTVHHQIVVGIVCGVVLAITLVLLILLGLCIKRGPAVKHRISGKLARFKMYLPGQSQGCQNFEQLKEEQVKANGVFTVSKG